MSFQPSETLWSRTYIGLIVSQFLAAFNDQAIHIVAIFYAGDMLITYAQVPYFHENTIIALVTSCFILPFFLFSTLAGMLADRYSKRTILVFWKVAEVGIMSLALVGFVLPYAASFGWADPGTLAIWSASLVIGAVFLMGTHSAFFIPAKYGVMPEILHATVLSEGNGFLEATSFVAAILGTAFGAGLYGLVKADSKPGTLPLGGEWLLGLILLGLACLGALGSLLIARMPPAAPDRPLTWKLWRPLWYNVSVLLRSRPLALSVIGIAFFAFLTLYARQTLLYDGETKKELKEVKNHISALGQSAKVGDEEENANAATWVADVKGPRGSELEVALMIGLVGLGIGLGSPLAGYLSGHKVELGLVPIGTFFIIVFTVALAFVYQLYWGKVACLVMIGVAAGFYIVPLYTLLQHRAPKDSKGNLVATSNFVNVVGGLIAVGVFWGLTGLLEWIYKLPLSLPLEMGNLQLLEQYRTQLETKSSLTQILFLAASLMTAAMMFILAHQLPDFSTRTLLWLRFLSRYRLHVLGLNNLPSDGPVILATNCESPERCMQVLTATDRFTRFILIEGSRDDRLPPVLGYLTKRTHLAILKPGKVTDEVLERTLADTMQVLQRGEMVALPANANGVAFDVNRFLGRLRARMPAQVLPVYCGPDESQPEAAAGRHIYVVIGHPVPQDTSADEIRQRIEALRLWVQHLGRKDKPPDATTGEIPLA
jgi:acyl-[acyl-carrier-protein]-phospholipid O-acyltransferase/long-chain-fatty-acid--[acyl-carrier-protein] ligase